MEDAQLVQLCQTIHYLAEDVPDIPFLKILSFVPIMNNFLKKISPICILHHDTTLLKNIPQRFGALVVESFPISTNIGMMNGGKNSDFIDGIVDFLGRQVKKFDLFKGIDGIVFIPSDLKDS